MLTGFLRFDSFPRFFFDADDGASGGDAGTDPLADDDPLDEGTKEPAAPKGKEGAEPKGESKPVGLLDAQRKKAAKPDGKKTDPNVPSKPEGLPDQFWDFEKHELRTDSFVKSWSDTKSSLDALRSSSKIPKEAAEYAKHLTDGKGNVVLPEGADRLGTMTDEDPVFQSYLQVAHKHNLTASQTRGLFNDFLLMMNDQLPEPFDEATEMAKLGENGKALLDVNVAWLESLGTRGILSEAQVRSLSIIGGSAEAVMAIDKLRMLSGERPIPTTQPIIGEGVPTAGELYQMRMDERYGVDPEWTAKVDKYWAMVFDNMSQEDLVGLGVSTMKTARPGAKFKA